MSIKRSLARLAQTTPRQLDVASVRGALPGQRRDTEHGELHLIDEYLELARTGLDMDRVVTFSLAMWLSFCLCCQRNSVAAAWR